MTMTAEQLEELLGKVTPDPWNVSTPVDGAPEFRVIQHGEYGHSDCGRYFHTSGQTSEDDATLIALAPSLARRVLAAEKLVKALEDISRPKYGLQGIMEDYEGEEYEREAKEYFALLTNRYARSAHEAVVAYREASK